MPNIVPVAAYYALAEVFVFLAVAELLHPLAQRAGLPTIVSDLALGIILSVSALGGLLNTLVGAPIFVVNSYVLVFADFSVVLLLFAAGLGGGFSGLRRAGGWAVAAAIVGDLVPFGLTLAVFSRFYSLDASLLLAVASAATSSAVVASLVRSGHLTSHRAGEFLMNVAALDDVVALVLLSVALTIVGGRVDVLSVTGSILESIIAWIVLLLAAVLIFPRLLRVRHIRDAQAMPFLFLFVLVVVVVSLGFSAVIGAFIAGLAIAESLVASRTRAMTDVLLILFGSLFFVVTGAQFDFHLFLELDVITLACVLAALAAAGKALAVWPFARRRLGGETEPAAVAVGMIPRGEIGLLVGSIGFTTGILTSAMLGEILLMSIITTVAGGYGFRRLAADIRRDDAPLDGGVARAAPGDPGG